ncbi:MAG: NAD(+) synthase [Microscillaceae bacterium]|jgi:NAD+ synthase (glutamine-hydrolysing)|nr:NAD(+) synthase [Microscillaceae bacterium]
MKLIKVGAAVLNQTPLDWSGNQRNIIQAIQSARNQGVTLLCLPELCITGYGCEDAFYAPFVHETALEILKNIAPETRGMIVSVGLPVIIQNKLFNTACLLVNGEIIGFVAKRFLAGDGIHYEPRWFMPWKQGERTHLTIDGEKYPLGDYYFEVGGVKIGFEICEDAWVANRPGRYLYESGIEIILNPSASHFAFGKLNVRKRFVLEGSRSFGVTYLYANLLGNEAGRAIYDGGALIASNGELLAVGERLGFQDHLVTTAVIDVDINKISQIQNRAPFQRVSPEENCIFVDFDYPERKPEPRQLQEPTWEKSEFIKEEEFTRALTLGLYDYMRKSRSTGFVVSLSGGADSSAVACLCRLMIDLGVKNIGWEAFTAKLTYIKNLPAIQTIPQLAKHLLTCAYQASQNSGDVTRNAAEQLAKALNASYFFLFIGDIVKDYESIVSESLGRPLTWEQDDVTLQNIQARVRAPSIWMFANIKNALLLSTSNRSEAAVGYATMDGDTSGGLSPIAGIDKAFLRQWLRWLEKEGVEGTLVVPELKWVNDQQPTAELRPQESKQTDESDLMPYDLLDEIEEYAIRDKKPPLECYLLLQAKYPQYSNEQLKIWTDKFFKLWCRNQWKRERYAPSFHVDDKNLDPKTWCRFPILSGGFERELKELWAYGE